MKKRNIIQNIYQNITWKKKNRLKKTEKNRIPFRSRTHDHKIYKTTHYLSANLCCSQIPINTLFCQFNSLFANTETYEAINKLHNYRIMYANFIHEYGVNFHEL